MAKLYNENTYLGLIFEGHIGDLEFDLYDYDLNNVIASNQPGSMFAQNTYYDFYDFDEDEDLGMHTFICKEDWKNKTI